MVTRFVQRDGRGGPPARGQQLAQSDTLSQWYCFRPR